MPEYDPFGGDGSGSSPSGSSTKPYTTPVPVVPGTGTSSSGSNTSQNRSFPERVDLGTVAPPASGVLANWNNGGGLTNFNDVLSSSYHLPGDIMGKPLSVVGTITGQQDFIKNAGHFIDDIPGMGIITGSYARALANEPLVTAWKKYHSADQNALVEDQYNPSLGYNLNDLGTDIGRTTTLTMFGLLLGGPIGAAIGAGIGLTISAIGVGAQVLASVNPFDADNGQGALDAMQKTYEASQTMNPVLKAITAMAGADYNRPIRTVGDLRQQMLENGFTEEDLTRIAEDPNKFGLTDFGHAEYGGGSAGLAGMGGAMNVLGDIGALGKGAELLGAAGKAFRGAEGVIEGAQAAKAIIGAGEVGGALSLAGKIPEAAKDLANTTASIYRFKQTAALGWREAVDVGLLSRRAKSAVEVAADLENGNLHQFTMQGFIGLLGSKYEGVEIWGQRYTRLAVGTYIGTGAAEVVAGGPTAPVQLPGGMSNFIDSVWKYNPLRDSEVLSLSMAFDIPTVVRGSGWFLSGVKSGIGKGAGWSAAQDRLLIDAIGKDNSVEGFDRMGPAARRQAVHGLFGGEEIYNDFVGHIMVDIAGRGSTRHGLNGVVLPYLEGIEQRAGSTMALSASAQDMKLLAFNRAKVLLKKGKITPQMVIDHAADWQANAGDFANVSGGVQAPGGLLNIHTQWKTWTEAFAPLREHAAATGSIVLGIRRSVLTKENLTMLESLIDNTDYDTLNPKKKREFIAMVLTSQMPRLVDQELPMIGPKTANFWLKGAIGKDIPPTKAELLASVRTLKSKAPTYQELMTQDLAREAGAPEVPQTNPSVVSPSVSDVNEIVAKVPLNNVLDNIGMFGPAATARLASVEPKLASDLDVLERTLVASGLGSNASKIETRFGVLGVEGEKNVTPLVRITSDASTEQTAAALLAVAMTSIEGSAVGIRIVTGERMAGMGLVANGTRVAIRAEKTMTAAQKIALDNVVAKAAAKGIDIVADTRAGTFTIYLDILPEQVSTDKTISGIMVELEKAFGKDAPQPIYEAANIERVTSGKEAQDAAAALAEAGARDPRIPFAIDFAQRVRSETSFGVPAAEELAGQAGGYRPLSLGKALGDLREALKSPTNTEAIDVALSNWVNASGQIPASRLGLIADELGDLGRELEKISRANSPLSSVIFDVADQLIRAYEPYSANPELAFIASSIDAAVLSQAPEGAASVAARREIVSVEEITRREKEFFNQARKAEEEEAAKAAKLREEQGLPPAEPIGRGFNTPQVKARDKILADAGVVFNETDPNPTLAPRDAEKAKIQTWKLLEIREAKKTREGRVALIGRGVIPNALDHVDPRIAAEVLAARGYEVPDLSNGITATIRKDLSDKLFELGYGISRNDESITQAGSKFVDKKITLSGDILTNEEVAKLGLVRNEYGGYAKKTILRNEISPGVFDEHIVYTGEKDWSMFREEITSTFKVRNGDSSSYGEALRAADWYQDFRTFFETIIGDDQVSKKWLYAFAHSQQAEGVVNGAKAMAQIMRAHNMGLLTIEEVLKSVKIFPEFAEKVSEARMLGKTKVIESIAAAIEGKQVTYGDDAFKITDFIDSFDGRKTRTVLGDAVVDSMPVAVDRHTIANAGVPDVRILKRPEFSGPTRDAYLNIEGDIPGDVKGPLRYEMASDLINEMAVKANEEAFLGRTDWEPREIQALGWAQFKAAIGDAEGSAIDAIRSLTTNVLLDLTPSKALPGLSVDVAHPAKLTKVQAKEIAKRVLEDPRVTQIFKDNSAFIINDANAGSFAAAPELIGVTNDGSSVTVSFRAFGPQSGVLASLREIAHATRQDFAIAIRTIETKDIAAFGNAARPSINLPIPAGVDADQLIPKIRAFFDPSVNGGKIDPDILAMWQSRGMTETQIKALAHAAEMKMPVAVMPDYVNGERVIRVIDTNHNIDAHTAYQIAYQNGAVHGKVNKAAEVADNLAAKRGLPQPVHESYKAPVADLHREIADMHIAAPYTQYADVPPFAGKLPTVAEADKLGIWTARRDTGLPADVIAAYDAFLADLREQYVSFSRRFKYEAVMVDPYNALIDGSPGVTAADLAGTDELARKKSVLARRDLEKGRLLVYGADAATPAMDPMANIIFRAIHDTAGHLTDGYSFGPQGELNALIKHLQVFKEGAPRRIAFIELGGQNSTNNFGWARRLENGSYATVATAEEMNAAREAGTLVRAETLPLIDRPFAVQKAYLPDEAVYQRFVEAYMPNEAQWTAAEIAMIEGKIRDMMTRDFNMPETPALSRDHVVIGGVSNNWTRYPNGEQYTTAAARIDADVRRLSSSKPGDVDSANWRSIQPAIAESASAVAESLSARAAARLSGDVDSASGQASAALVEAHRAVVPELVDAAKASAPLDDVVATFDQYRKPVREKASNLERMASAKQAAQKDTVLPDGELIPALDTYLQDYIDGYGEYSTSDRELLAQRDSWLPEDRQINSGNDAINYRSEKIAMQRAIKRNLGTIGQRMFPGTMQRVTEAEHAANLADGYIPVYRGLTKRALNVEGKTSPSFADYKAAARERAAEFVDLPISPEATAGGGWNVYGSAPRGYWATDFYSGTGNAMSGASYKTKPQTAEQLAKIYGGGNEYRNGAGRRAGVVLAGSISPDANVIKVYSGGEFIDKIELPDGRVIERTGDHLTMREIFADLGIPEGNDFGDRFVGNNMVSFFAIREGADAAAIIGWERGAAAFGDQIMVFNPEAVHVVDPRLEGSVFNKAGKAIDIESGKPRELPSKTDPEYTIAGRRRAPIEYGMSTPRPTDVAEYNSRFGTSYTYEELQAITAETRTKLLGMAREATPSRLGDELAQMAHDGVPSKVAPEEFNPDRYEHVLYRGFHSPYDSPELATKAKETAREWALDQVDGHGRKMEGMMGYGNYWATDLVNKDPAQSDMGILMAEMYARRAKSSGPSGSAAPIVTTPRDKLTGAIQYNNPETARLNGVVMQAGLAKDAKVMTVGYSHSAESQLAELFKPGTIGTGRTSSGFESIMKAHIETVLSDIIQTDLAALAQNGEVVYGEEFRGILQMIGKSMRTPGTGWTSDFFHMINGSVADEFVPNKMGKVFAHYLKETWTPENDSLMIQRGLERFADEIDTLKYSLNSRAGTDEWGPVWLSNWATYHGYDAIMTTTQDGEILNVLNQGALEIVDPTLTGGTMNMQRKVEGSQRSEILGQTGYKNDQTILKLVRGKADASTVIHELAHSWLQRGILSDEVVFQIADALGINHGIKPSDANKLRLDVRLQESFATQFEAFVAGGAEGTALEPQFKKYGEYVRGVYESIKQTLPDVNPEIDMVLQTIFKSTQAEAVAGVARGRTSLKALTFAEADLNATGDKELASILAKRDAEALQLHDNTPPDWSDPRMAGVSKDFRDSLAPLQKKLDQENSIYTLTPAPYLSIQPDPMYGRMVSEFLKDGWSWRDGTLGRVLRGTQIARVGDFLGWLATSPSNYQWARNARQAIYSEFISKGASVDQVNALVAEINKSRQAYFDTLSIQWSISNLSLGYLNRSINTVFEATEEGRAVLKAIGGEKGAVRAIERAVSKFYQGIDTEAVGVKGAINRALERSYVVHQNIPGVRRSLRFVRLLYPTVRFYLDPRWHMLNAYETDIMLGAQYGLKATRWGGAAEALPDMAYLQHSGMIDTRQFAVDPKKEIKRAISSATGRQVTLPEGPLAVESLLGEYGGGFHDTRDHRAMSGRITRALQQTRTENAARVAATADASLNDLAAVTRAIDEHGKLDPYINDLRNIVKERNKPLSQVLDGELYSINEHGFNGAVERMEKDILTADEREVLRPLLQTLYDKNQESYNSMLANLRGNPSRTNAEKLLNNYFLYWPTSYMIKATKWLFQTISTHHGEMSGVKIVRGNKLVEYHYRYLMTSPDYRRIFEDHPAAWRFANMIMPVSPILSEDGVSLSRQVRYIGGAMGLWPKYRASTDPAAFVNSVAQLGLPYTLSLLNDLMSETFKSQP